MYLDDRGSGQAVPALAELRILLVEDSELLQARLTELLAEPGIMRVVASAATERDAKNCIDSQTFDVLLVDVALREGSGIGVIAYARARCTGHQPLIIVLTNHPLPAVKQRCLGAGADFFLDKMREFQQVRPLIAGARPAAS